MRILFALTFLDSPENDRQHVKRIHEHLAANYRPRHPQREVRSSAPLMPLLLVQTRQTLVEHDLAAQTASLLVLVDFMLRHVHHHRVVAAVVTAAVVAVAIVNGVSCFAIHGAYVFSWSRFLNAVDSAENQSTSCRPFI